MTLYARVFRRYTGFVIFETYPIFGYLLALFFGLGSGSYATMPAYRLPRGEAAGGRWVGPRSKCPSCGTKLRTRDLVPVFNWLLTLGKCHFCGVKISLNYLFIEASCALLSVFLFWKYGFSEQYLLLMLCGVCLIILLSTDWHHHMFPKQILYTLLVTGVAWRVLQDGQLFFMVNSVVASLLVCFAYKGITEQRGGEVQRYDWLMFVGLSGLWLNEAQLVVYLLMAGALLLVKKLRGAALILPFYASILWDIPKRLF